MPDNNSGQLPSSVGIGSLRWVVTLCRRDQAPADDLALQETLVPIATVHADIQPTYASTFYQTTQVDTPVTHMINVRFQDYPATIDVVVRNTRRPDGSQRVELFRVRRTKEVGGRKRFLQMECELEHSRIVPPSVTTFTTWDGAATTWDATPNDTSWDLFVTPAVGLTEPYDGGAS